MEGFGNPPLNAAEVVMKKRPRSVASRKPRPKEQLASEYKDISCAPSRSISPDDDLGTSHRRKELFLNGPEMRGSKPHGGTDVSKKARRGDRAGGGDHDAAHARTGTVKHSSPAPSCSTNSGPPLDISQLPSGDTSNAPPPANRLRKVKLKVSGLNRTIQTKPIQEVADAGAPGTSDASSRRHKHKDSGEQKHYSRSKDTHGNHTDGKRGDKHDISPSSDLVRKSKRVPKKRTLDSDDEDGELRYLEKLKVAKAAQEHPIATNSPLAYGYGEDGLRKKKLSKVSKTKGTPYEMDNDFTMSQSSRDGRKNLELEDGDDFIEEDESGLDEPRRLKEADSPSSVKVEAPGLTTRQRALHGRGGHGESVIEYPDGLPAATSRKQKEKLPDVEIQAKKAEVAQRRKMQVEKAEREQQAEAMRKILGIDTEKKKEERKQKEREDKEKQARFEEYKRSCIQCVMGPEGTVITFPDSIGLPSIFSSKPSSYPPPREKCAGPSCPNPYKYRDSKTKLPLCSLECYKAVQGSNRTLAC
ncbi:hypothetical protein ACQ4PT_063179 [Festuca glaucescens]